MVTINTIISDFVWKDLNEVHVKAIKDKFWESLLETGTELWLDTGDMEEAGANWSAEMSALTTNNTLLNNEIQKGTYDDFILEAKSIVKNLSKDEQIKEIAFILNARHGLRLAKKFGGFVSVELHTEIAHDINSIEYYGKRYHEICPEQFIVKVPYTAEGLLGARRLKDSGVRINFTLEFSARENVLVTRVARPDYANVFLGRIGAYIINNHLGDGSGAGEKAVIASQNWVTGLSAMNPWQTKLIAASLRNHNQLELLAGTDVFTMPPKVAASGKKELSGKFSPYLLYGLMSSQVIQRMFGRSGSFFSPAIFLQEIEKKVAKIKGLVNLLNCFMSLLILINSGQWLLFLHFYWIFKAHI